MLKAIRKTESTGLAVTVFTTDQQLYRVVVIITWVCPRLFQRFIPRLGGTHRLMSFVGYVEYVTAKAGLKETLEASFSGVSKLLSEKKKCAKD